ncbi:MAG: hypothetical protein AAF490_33115 [Chloroflexota bacterium]
MKKIYRLFIILSIFLTMGLIACAPSTGDAIPIPVFEEPAENVEEPADDADAFDLENVPSARDSEPQLVYVDSAEVIILESFPVQVQVALSGTLSDGCISLESVTPRFDGESFVLELNADRPSDMMCTAVLTPFEEVVSLEVDGLKAGTYTVQVQDQNTSFTLEMDNSFDG